VRRCIAVAAAGFTACGPAPAPEHAGQVAGDTVVVMPAGTAAAAQRVPADPAVVAPAAPAHPASPAADTLPEVRGRIVVSGTEHEPLTTLRVDGRMALIVTGPLAPELRSLAGAAVAVRGVESGAARRTIHVESYEIIEIHGERPVVGVVLAGHRLAAGADTLALVGAPPEMRAGSRVWITGERQGRELRVASWGLIGSRTQ
jgi:hypothetical protein